MSESSILKENQSMEDSPPEAAAHPVCLRRRGVRDDASIVPYTGSR